MIEEIYRKGYFVFKYFFNESEINKLDFFLKEDLLKEDYNRIHDCSALCWIHTPKNVSMYLESINIKNKILNILSDICNGYDISVGVRGFIKKKGSLPTQWHQDSAYTDKEFHGKRLNFWVPLNDINKKNGAMKYIESSHMLGLVKHSKYTFDETGSTLFIDGVNDMDSVTVDVFKGDAIVHNDLVFHSSHPNLSDNDREVIVLTVTLKETIYE